MCAGLQPVFQMDACPNNFYVCSDWLWGRHGSVALPLSSLR